MPRLAALVLLFVAGGSPALAQFFSVTNQGVSNITGTGARALGMGGAFIAIADDATAASWNPAGLAQLTKPEVSLVGEAFAGSYDDTSDEIRFWESGERSTRLTRGSGDFDARGLRFVSGTWPFELAGIPIVVQASYHRLASYPNLDREGHAEDRRFGPDGEELESRQVWATTSDHWSGGFDAYSVSVAAQLYPSLRIGISANDLEVDAGNRFAYRLDWSSGAVEGMDSKRGFELSGFTADLGVQWQPVAGFSVGGVYHFGMETDEDYWWQDLSYRSDPPSLVEESGRATARVVWPDGWGLGVGWRARDHLLVSADYGRIHWSKGSYAGSAGAGAFPFDGADQEDSWTARCGVEYSWVAANGIVIPLRAGYFREHQLAAFVEFRPEGGARTFAEGAPNFDGISLGTGLAFGNFQLDLAWVRTEGDQSKRPLWLDGTTLAIGERIVEYTSNRFLLSTIVRF